MQTQAPSIGRILVAVGFALSCFGLLLFLWITFGGPTPFAAQSYRFTAEFPEAVTLSKEAEVRIGGVTVGKVKQLELPPSGNATEATIELEPEFAPIPEDTRAILRQKTLLGETFIELTGGTRDAPKLEDGGHLERSQTQDSTQIDEIFQGLDRETRTAFRIWMQGAAQSINGRGLDLSDALGNLGPFTTDATRILRILNRQDAAVRGLIRDTGAVFAALTERDNELASAITGSNATFEALASRDRALTETFQILPTFENETRLTLNRVARFADNAEPLVLDLKPVADDLTPTFHSLRRLSPHLRNLFVDLGPLIRASIKPGTQPLQGGLPALRRTLARLKPVLASLDPFLANLNPVIRYLEFYKRQTGDFLAGPGHGFGARLVDIPGAPPRHALRVITMFNSETLGVHDHRPASNRGNAYLAPDAINSPNSVSHGGLPSFDCNNTGGEHGATVNPYIGIGGNGEPPCFLQPNFPSEWGGGRAPQMPADP
jgi:phospholipid/cholesterol/gamma-HCH transport system substrate-binding protein